jgi:hypothetical protein
MTEAPDLRASRVIASPKPREEPVINHTLDMLTFRLIGEEILRCFEVMKLVNDGDGSV